MSKGWGKRQWWWFDLARNKFSDFDASEGWTFGQVCEACWPGAKKRKFYDPLAGTKRSMRRALQGLVKERVILAVGGPSHPRRDYVINPHVLREDDPLRAKIFAGLAADGVTVSPCGHFSALKAHTEHLADGVA